MVVVVVMATDLAHGGTSSVPASGHQGEKIASKAVLNALAV